MGIPAENRLGIGQPDFAEHQDGPLFCLGGGDILVDADGLDHLLANPDDGV